MSTTLGLDLGPNSIGWALLDDSQGRLVGAGVRAFPEGVANFGTSKEVSRNEQRRGARMMRRQTRRRSFRKRRLRETLITVGLFPADPTEQEKLFALDPYALRARALDERLDPHQIGRIVLHLNQRRGFLSSRKHDRGDKEVKGMLAEISGLAEDMKATGARTLGEYLHRKYASLDHRRRSEDDHVRGRHTRRDMLEGEFRAIWGAQKAYHGDLLTDALCFGRLGRMKYPRKPLAKHDASREGGSDLETFGLHGLVFFQRPTYWPRSVVGLCELEPRERRCPVADRLAQRCRLLQEVNNLRYIDPDARAERALSQEQRALLLDYLGTRQKATFDEIRKKLGFDGDIRFNLEQAKRPSIKGMTTDWQLAKAVGKDWHRRAEAEKNAIVALLIDPNADEDADVEELAESYGFTHEQAEALVSVNLASGYGNLSRKAIEKLLPHLERGLRYMGTDEEDSALHAAGYLRRDQLRRRIFDQLPMPERARDSRIGEIPNPVVKRALVELRKVVNAIIREHGKPDAIHVEMARSVQMGGQKRREYINAMRDRETQRSKAADALRAAGDRVTGEAITRYLLWQRQGRECMYCGQAISQAQLFGGETDVDHILPYSRSLDGSQANKVVCHRRCNATKGQRTVYEWLAQSDPDAYHRVCSQAQSLLRKHRLPYGTYRRILQESVNLEEFTSRQLVDTGYIAKATAEYLRCLFQADHAVLGLKGQHTATLRYQWGLETILAELPDSPAWAEQAKLRPGEKNRADHRHHTIDAIVLALTNRSRLQQLARYRRLAPGQEVDPETGEVLELPLPWDGFRRDVLEAVGDIKVSHRVRRKVSGALHEDTLYGPVSDNAGQRVAGQFVVRKPLDAISPNEVPLIRDPAIRRIVTQRLTDKGIDIGRGKSPNRVAFREALAGLEMPSGVPIRKVRVVRSDLTIRPIRADKAGQAWVKPGSNHHLCIFEWTDKGEAKREAVFVSMLEAARRAKAKRPIIERTPPQGHPTIPADAKFVMSLSAGEMVLAERKGQTKLLVFKTASSTQGQIWFVENTDARPSTKQARFALMANTLRGRKVTVDPLGRIRWASD